MLVFNVLIGYVDQRSVNEFFGTVTASQTFFHLYSKFTTSNYNGKTLRHKPMSERYAMYIFYVIVSAVVVRKKKIRELMTN